MRAGLWRGAGYEIQCRLACPDLARAAGPARDGEAGLARVGKVRVRHGAGGGRGCARGVRAVLEAGATVANRRSHEDRRADMVSSAAARADPAGFLQGTGACGRARIDRELVVLVRPMAGDRMVVLLPGDDGSEDPAPIAAADNSWLADVAEGTSAGFLPTGHTVARGLDVPAVCHGGEHQYRRPAFATHVRSAGRGHGVGVQPPEPAGAVVRLAVRCLAIAGDRARVSLFHRVLQ